MRTNASTSGWSRSPSIVVTSRSPTVCDERDAGVDRHAVEEHRAGAAVPFAAGDLRPGQADVVAQGLRQRPPDRQLELVRVAVDAELKRHSVTARMSARWMSRNVSAVAVEPLVLVLDLGQLAPELARRLDQELADLLDRSATFPLRSSQAFSARPSTPIVSGCRVHSSGVAIDRYWWIRASAIDCGSVAGPVGSVGSSGGSPLAIRFRVAGEHPAQLRPRRARPSCAVRSAMSSEPRLPPVRVVGGVENLLGRDLVEEVEEVDGAPDRGVEEDARLPGEMPREPGEIGDARVGDDQLRVGVRVGEAPRARRRSAAGRDRRG